MARRAALLALLLAAPATGAPAGAAPAPTARPRRLPALDGGEVEVPVAGARVTVVAFVRTGQEHSRRGLEQVRAIEAELGARGVRAVAVASAAEDRAALLALARSGGPAVPLLLDAGDALYGAYGVKQHPAFAVLGPDGRLSAWQPYQTINNRELLRALVRQALGEIGQAEVDAARDPPAARDGGGRAATRVRLGARLLQHGNGGGAAAQAREAILLDPAYAPAHGLLAAALVAQGRCAEAAGSAGLALRLQPDEPRALAARRACPGR